MEENKIVKFNDFNNKERIEEEHLYILYRDGRKIVFLGVESSELTEKLTEYNGLFVVSSYTIEEKDYKLIILNTVINGQCDFSNPVTTIVKLYEPSVREQQFLINIFKGSPLPFNIDMEFTENYKKMKYICSSYIGLKDSPIPLPETEFNGLEVKTFFKDVKIIEPIKYKYCKDQYVKVGNKNLEIVECRPTFDENDTVEYFDVSEDDEYYNNISLVSFNTIYDLAFKLVLYKSGEDIQIDVARLAPSHPEQLSVSIKISYFGDKPKLFLSHYDVRSGFLGEININENSSITKIDDFSYDIVLDYDWIPEEGIEVYFYSIKFNIRKFK